MLDCDLIIDHLSAPASPFDGFGLFNISYDLSYKTKNQIFISKKNHKTAPYHVNESFDTNKKSVILNEIKEIQCRECTMQATRLVFVDHPRVLVPVCENHIFNLNGRELDADLKSELDIRTAESSIRKHVSTTKEINGEFIKINIHNPKNG